MTGNGPGLTVASDDEFSLRGAVGLPRSRLRHRDYYQFSGVLVLKGPTGRHDQGRAAGYSGSARRFVTRNGDRTTKNMPNAKTSIAAMYHGHGAKKNGVAVPVGGLERYM